MGVRNSSSSSRQRLTVGNHQGSWTSELLYLTAGDRPGQFCTCWAEGLSGHVTARESTTGAGHFKAQVKRETFLTGEADLEFWS